jgi:hypothetical protein
MAVAELHPSVEELTAFTLGSLGDEAYAVVEAHVAGCPSCQERAAVAPGDNLVELLRCVHVRSGQPADTVAEGAAQVQTPAPLSVRPEAVTLPPRPPAAPAEVARPATPDAVPPELARHERYHVVRLLGTGGMGAVYEAEHRVMRRAVALKVINGAFTANTAGLERFRREVRAAARLSHPNIVTTYDAEDAGDTHFLVMEYVEGVSLGRLVKDRGPLPVAEACDYVRQAALGLQHAHERGMVHRDVKPDNLVRCADGTIKVLDFGLAVLSAEGGGTLTETNVLMGTPAFMAPEQAEDPRSADIRADVYSLGCTFYYLLTGKVPYPASTRLLQILAHREQPVPAISQARPDVPAELSLVLERLLAKKSGDRYATPGAVAAALEPFAKPQPAGGSETVALSGAGSPRRPRRRVLVAAIAAVLLAGLALAGAIVYRIQTDKGELVIETESPDVEVVIKQGGKQVDVIDTKTDKRVKLALRSGDYELELQGKHEGLKLNLEKATLTRGETVIARIERVAKPGQPRVPAVPILKPLHQIEWTEGGNFAMIDVSADGSHFLATKFARVAPQIWETQTGKPVGRTRPRT